MLVAEQLECLGQFLFLDRCACGAGEDQLHGGADATTRLDQNDRLPSEITKKTRLRVVVSPAPFTSNAGQTSLSFLRRMPLLNATITDMESDGWREFPAERQRILDRMHEIQQPVFLLSGDMHWAGVFDAGGVVEVSASPMAQVFTHTYAHTHMSFPRREPNFMRASYAAPILEPCNTAARHRLPALAHLPCREVGPARSRATRIDLTRAPLRALHAAGSCRWRLGRRRRRCLRANMLSL